MITIGFSTKEIDNDFIDHIKKTCGPKNIEIIPFENKGTHSLTEAYNIILDKSSNDIVVLCHDDIYFDKKGWGNKIIKHFDKNPEYGILGVAGGVELPKSAKWWENPSKMRGIVNHEHEGKKWESKYSNSLGNKIDEVVITDGVFMSLHKNRIKKRFNEEIKGFHFYDISFTFENYLENVKIGVMYDVRITHYSIGQTNDEWENNRIKLSERYYNELPKKIKLKENDKINVLISSLLFKDYTGSEMYVYELAKELTKLNCEVSITSNIGDPMVKRIKKFGVKCFSINEPPGFKLGDGRWFLNTPKGKVISQKNKLYKTSNVKLDVIHTQHKPITERVCELYPNIPKVCTIHSEVIDLETPIIENSIKKYITIREEIKEKIINKDGVDKDCVDVIYNPIDNTKFNTKNTKKGEYILFVGTVDYLRKESLFDISDYAKSIGKELWIVGENKSNYLNEITSKEHVKYFESTPDVEKYVKGCFQTAGILLGRTTIEGWMCGKDGWIYTINDKGNVLDKTLNLVPDDIGKFYTHEVAKKIKSVYIDVLNDEGMKFNERVILPNNTLNWGDLVPYKIIDGLFECGLNEGDVFNVKNAGKRYPVLSTGSIMHFTNKDCIVWGSGCIDEGRVGESPKKVYAVRGPLTRNELLKRNIECPEVYGDPALLYPKIYNPKIEKKYKWGIIPHYIEYESLHDIKTIKNLEQKGFKVIDICSGSKNFINELLEVENVISSSLHGLIVADAYGIPNARIRISNKLIGGDFKFKDYYLSVNREIDLGLQLSKDTTLEEIENLHYNKKINIDLDLLLNSSPWKAKNNLIA